jgi:3-hydroxyisobutyrate dehydrogenase
MASKHTVAVLGAGGIMGRGIAANLARAGIDTRAWNRTREKAEPLSEHGVAVADTAAEAASGATALLTIVTDGEAVFEAMGGSEGAFAGADGSPIWLQMSTIGIEGIQRCDELAEVHGLALIDAPVLGTKQPAEKGELVVMAAGPHNVREDVAPLFDAVGKRTVWLDAVGDATRLKLAVNAWILSVTEGSAETMALAEGLGVDPAMLLDVVGGGPLDLPYLQMKGRAMIERDFEPSFRLALAAKDARLVEDAIEEAGLALPLLETIRKRLEEGEDAYGDADMAATFLTSAPAD